MGIVFPKPYEVYPVWGNESWIASVLEEGSSGVNDKTLKEVVPDFPLLVKIIKADRDLSIQVHPKEKSECWYVLDCKPNAQLVLGIHVNKEQSIKDAIEDKQWNKISINKGDFIQVDPGTIHAIPGHATMLEIQDPCNVTYRVYDYGSDRELHIDKALKVIDKRNDYFIKNFKNASSGLMYKNSRYSIELININTKLDYINKNKNTCYIVIEGKGSVNSNPINVEDCFIVPEINEKLNFSGNMKLISAFV